MIRSDVPRGKGRGKRRRGKDRQFMDAALDAYIRDSALHLWRDFEVYRARSPGDAPAALAEAGFFGDKLAYAPIWSGHWARLVLPSADLTDGELYARMEEAVRAAVLEEREARKHSGDRPFEDLEEYNDFLRRTLNKLLADDRAPGEVPQ